MNILKHGTAAALFLGFAALALYFASTTGVVIP
jgi:hypothetical protein